VGVPGLEPDREPGLKPPDVVGLVPPPLRLRGRVPEGLWSESARLWLTVVKDGGGRRGASRVGAGAREERLWADAECRSRRPGFLPPSDEELSGDFFCGFGEWAGEALLEEVPASLADPMESKEEMRFPLDWTPSSMMSCVV
jgi:hypothetical protein